MDFVRSNFGSNEPLPVENFFLTFWPVFCVWAAKIGPNWPNWQCFLAGSSKTAPRILIFSIAMCADYSFYVKSIATFALTLFGYIILVLASAFSLLWRGTFSSWTTEKVLFYINSELSFLGTKRYSQRSCVQFSDHSVIADQFAGLGLFELSIYLS